MSSVLKELYQSLKTIREYLIKIGPSRRQGRIVIQKLKEAKVLYDKYTLIINELSVDITQGKLSSLDAQIVTKISSDFQSLYSNIVDLCSKESLEAESSDSSEEFKDSIVEKTMELFNLKTALSLLPVMSDNEANTKQLIDNIEYYSSILKNDDCQTKLIQFVLKSRLSQVAKLKLNKAYSNISDLIKDMRTELLPQKSAPAIQNKLQQIRQNDLSIQEYGKEITELFTELTITQSNGNPDSFNILRPVNEKYAIKKFADGLRNRRLSTVIAARNYSSLKDAIQAAKEEETETASTSADVMGMYYNNSYNFRGRPNNYRGTRANYDTRVFSNARNGNSSSQGQRVSDQGQSFNDNFQQSPRRMVKRRPWQTRGRYNNFNNRGNQRICNERMRIANTEDTSENSNENQPQNDNVENQFFREQ